MQTKKVIFIFAIILLSVNFDLLSAADAAVKAEVVTSPVVQSPSGSLSQSISSAVSVKVVKKTFKPAKAQKLIKKSTIEVDKTFDALPIDDKLVDAYKSRKVHFTKLIPEADKITSKCFEKLKPFMLNMSGTFQASLVYGAFVAASKSPVERCVDPATFKKSYKDGVLDNIKYQVAKLDITRYEVRNSLHCVLTSAKSVNAVVDAQEYLTTYNKGNQILATFLLNLSPIIAKRVRFFLRKLTVLDSFLVTKTNENNVKEYIGFKYSLDEAKNIVSYYLTFAKAFALNQGEYLKKADEDIIDDLAEDSKCTFNSESYCAFKQDKIKEKYKDVLSEEDFKNLSNAKDQENVAALKKDLSFANDMYKNIKTKLPAEEKKKVETDCNYTADEDYKKARMLENSAIPETDADITLPEDFIKLDAKCVSAIKGYCTGHKFIEQYANLQSVQYKPFAECVEQNKTDEQFITDSVLVNRCLDKILRSITLGAKDILSIDGVKLNKDSLLVTSKTVRYLADVTITNLLFDESNKTADTDDSESTVDGDYLTADLIKIDGTTTTTLAKPDEQEKEMQDAASKEAGNSTSIITYSVALIAMIIALM